MSTFDFWVAKLIESLLIIWTCRNAKGLSQPETLVRDGDSQRIPRFRFLKLRYLKGLKARHIVSRWRKPPEPCEKKYLRPEGPTQQPVCRPFRPQFVDDSDPVARATGIGCIGPPGLICENSKLTLRVVINPLRCGKFIKSTSSNGLQRVLLSRSKQSVVMETKGVNGSRSIGFEQQGSDDK